MGSLPSFIVNNLYFTMATGSEILQSSVVKKLIIFTILGYLFIGVEFFYGISTQATIALREAAERAKRASQFNPDRDPKLKEVHPFIKQKNLDKACTQTWERNYEEDPLQLHWALPTNSTIPMMYIHGCDVPCVITTGEEYGSTADAVISDGDHPDEKGVCENYKRVLWDPSGSIPPNNYHAVLTSWIPTQRETDLKSKIKRISSPFFAWGQYNFYDDIIKMEDRIPDRVILFALSPCDSLHDHTLALINALLAQGIGVDVFTDSCTIPPSPNVRKITAKNSISGELRARERVLAAEKYSVSIVAQPLEIPSFVSDDLFIPLLAGSVPLLVASKEVELGRFSPVRGAIMKWDGRKKLVSKVVDKVKNILDKCNPNNLYEKLEWKNGITKINPDFESFVLSYQRTFMH